MDQNAFRSLVSSRAGASSSTAQPSRGILGAPAPKRGTAWGIKPKPGNEYKPNKDNNDEGAAPAFAPRSQNRAKVKQGKYLDRAEMRRQGIDDEYKPVEKLLEDFERRQEEEGADAKDIAKTRAYLGGDATHSILVKGLDYALLAARKAELAEKGEEIADEELEALVKNARKGKAEDSVKDSKAEVKEEGLGKGFKTITKKASVEGETKKKKKKKKVKTEAEGGVYQSVLAPAKNITTRPSDGKSGLRADRETKGESTTSPGPSKTKIPTPPPPLIDNDEDIFGDVGAYDLGAGRPDDSDSDEEDGEDMDVDERAPRRRSRSRSRSPSRSRSRSRSRSYDRYDGRPRERERYRSRSPSRDRYADRRSHNDRTYSPPRRGGRDERYYSSRRDSRSRSPYYRRRSPSPSRWRERSYSRDRSYSRERNYRRRSYSHSPSRSPPPPRRRSQSPAPAASATKRQRTRSPSPMLFDPYARPPSRSPTPSSEEDITGPGGKLQPLQSSALPDLKGFLSAEAENAKAEDKRAKKAKWRAKQGLAPQEGTEGLAEKSMNEKQKLNRDYVLMMNKLNKDGDAEAFKD